MKTENLNINYQNVSYLYNKINDIKIELLKSTKTIHLLGVSETHLDEKVDDNHIEIQNYTLLRVDQQNHLHTGMVVYIHQSICQYIKRRNDLEINNVECIWLEFKQDKTTTLLVCFIYRNPDDTFRPWLDRYEYMIDNVLDKNFEIVILGDYNIDLHKQQTTWNNLTLSLGFTQLIKETTRVTSGTLIDHIYTNNKEKIATANVIKTSMSDHYMITCSYTTKINLDKKKGHKSVQYRCYKNFNNISFLADLNRLPLDNVYHTTDPDIALKTFLDLITPIINKHIPLKTRRVKHANLPTWINSDIIKGMEIRDKCKQSKIKKSNELKTLLKKNIKYGHKCNSTRHNQGKRTQRSIKSIKKWIQLPQK